MITLPKILFSKYNLNHKTITAQNFHYLLPRAKQCTIVFKYKTSLSNSHSLIKFINLVINIKFVKH